MLWVPRKSALFIDYENVAHKQMAATIQNWLAWLEQGEFDEKKKRRTFVLKQVYWNSAAEQHRKKFEEAGFKPVLCEKFAGLKNGADIRMALDILETVADHPKIKEFILVTKDSDFIPVLQRLRQKSKLTAVLVDEHKLTTHTTYRHHADIVIPTREFNAATAFSKPLRRMPLRRSLAWMKERVGAATRDMASRRSANRGGESGRAEKLDPIDLAVDHAIRVTSFKPNLATAHRDIEKEFSKIRGFSKTGKNAYLGKGSFRKLMQAVAARTDRIKITPAAGGGIAVWYIPKDED